MNFKRAERSLSALKGLRKNNFTELAPRFRSDLFDPKLQSHSNSRPISRTLRLRIGQRWSEDGMLKCEVIFARALSQMSYLGQQKFLLRTCDTVSLANFNHSLMIRLHTKYCGRSHFMQAYVRKRSLRLCGLPSFFLVPTGVHKLNSPQSEHYDK